MRRIEEMAWKVPLVLVLVILAWGVAAFIVLDAAVSGCKRRKANADALVGEWRSGRAIWGLLEILEV